jgi:anti-sigma B factor antagonist
MHPLSSRVPVFELRIRPQRSHVVVDLEGELDCATVPRLAEAIDELRAVGWEHVVVDMEAVSFIDSTGLRLLLSVDARASREGWRFAVHGECPALERLLVIGRLQDRFART